MKKLIVALIASVFLIIGCQAPSPPPETPSKFKTGEVVYVDNQAFIVNYYEESYDYYLLQQIDCKSEECHFRVRESEISKTKQ